MNRSQLVDAICKETGYDHRAVDATVQSMLHQTALAVRKGEPVTLTGFGTFERLERRARQARNPRTGEAIKVKAKKVPRFRPGATLTDIVQTGKPQGRGAAGWAQPATTSTSRSSSSGKGSGGASRRTGTAGTRARTSTSSARPRAQRPATVRAGSARNTQRGSRRRG